MRARSSKSLRKFITFFGVAITGLGLAATAVDTPLGNRAQDAIFDSYQRAAPRHFDVEAPVHIVDIDEASLAHYGQWPWPRTYLRALNEALFANGAAVVGYDILFSEPDRTAPEITSQLGDVTRPPQLAQATSFDAAFAASLAGAPTVLAVAGAKNGTAPVPKSGISHTGDDPTAALVRYPGALQSLPVLRDAATGVGAISLGEMPDGIVRAVPMVTVMGDQMVPGLAAETLRVAQGAGGFILKTSQASGETSGGTSSPVALRIGGFEAPLDGQGRLRLYLSGHRPERFTSAREVLAGPTPALADKLAGKIILVGASAQGLYDLRATALNAGLPGVEIHAEVLEQILAEQHLLRPDWAPGLELLLVALAGLTVTGFLLFQRPVWALGGTVCVVFGMIATSAWAFGAQGYLISPLWPVLTALAVFVPGISTVVIFKERARRAINARFAHFLPPALIREIARDPSRALTPDGAERELSVIFVDMRRFSTITEHMSPSDVVRMVNVYLGAVSETLVAHGATIDKFIGDAVMAFWNAPLRADNHRQCAVAAISALGTAIAAANQRLQSQGLPAVEIAVGLNTGPCFVGLMGSQNRLSYSCVGDSVTLAARLEGLTRIYGVGNCVGPNTVHELASDVIAPVLDLVAVKGRNQATAVHSIWQNSAENRAAADVLLLARTAFLNRNWAAAQQKFTELSKHHVDGYALVTLAQIYLDQIETYRTTAPASGWDGSTLLGRKR